MSHYNFELDTYVGGHNGGIQRDHCGLQERAGEEEDGAKMRKIKSGPKAVIKTHHCDRYGVDVVPLNAPPEHLVIHD